MNTRRRLQVSLVELVLFLLVGLIGWATWRTYWVVEEVTRAPAALGRIEREYGEIADKVLTFVDESHDALDTIAIRGDRAAWSRFQQCSRGFERWLNERAQSVTPGKIVMVQPIGLTVDIGSLLADIKVANTDYLRTAAPLDAAGLSLDQVHIIEESAEDKGRRLQTFGIQARAQADGIGLFLRGSDRWFWWLHRLLLAAALTLAVAGGWLVLVVYRRVVSPLRARLVESQAIIEQQQKLAHFGELAAAVAHEIRNPLAAISTRLFTLQRTLARGSREDEDATVIRGEINRLNRIVTEFLESARPSAPLLIPMTAGQLFEQVQRLLGPTAEKQNIRLSIEETTEALFLGDINQLTQVFINLIQNATESIGQNGTVRLRARQTQQRLHDDMADLVQLEVEDDGPGIPPEVHGRLFDPFFSNRKGGTGLGLSIAARIVDRHCGKIGFRSQPGRTVFIINLPVHQSTP